MKMPIAPNRTKFLKKITRRTPHVRQNVVTAGLLSPPSVIAGDGGDSQYKLVARIGLADVNGAAAASFQVESRDARRRLFQGIAAAVKILGEGEPRGIGRGGNELHAEAADRDTHTGIADHEAFEIP
jgi:hypothetical protein